MTISDVLYLLCNFFLLIITIQMLDDFLIEKGADRHWLIGASIIFYGSTLFACKFISITIVNFLVNLICIFILSMAFSGNIGKKILVSFVIAIINAASDIIAYMLIPSVSDIDDINLSFIGTVLIVQVCERIIKRIFKNKEKTPLVPYHGMILVIIPFCSLGIIYSSARMNYGKYYTFLIAFCVLIINLITFYLYQLAEENYLQQIQNIVLEERVKAYSNELETMTESQSKVRSLQHDMRHHIIELEGLVHKHEWIKIKDYLENMKMALNNSNEYVYSGNFEMDSLLNFLLQEAYEKLEKIDAKIIIPEDIKINTFKFNVIVGNLLENAIQAAEESEDKTLSIEIQQDKGTLFLTIKNSYKRIIKNAGSFLSTKSDKNNHGIGMKNVERIVEESKGEMRVHVDGNFFVVNVMLYIDKLS